MNTLLALVLATGTASADSTRILVRLHDPSTAEELALDTDTTLFRQHPEIGVVVLTTEEARVQELLQGLAEDSRAVWAEPDGIVRTQWIDDPLYRNQWNLRRVGTQSAWSCGAQGAGVIVAVLDTGVSDEGEDAPWLTDGTSFVEPASATSDGNGHGTHVAGTIAQRTGNGYGVAGMAPLAEVMPVKVLSDSGSGYWSDVAAGILWAVDEGAEVINLSLGGPTESSTVDAAVRFARTMDTVVVAAAGNDGPDSPVYYPAASPGVLGISATTRAGTSADYSNSGLEVDFAAPGGSNARGRGIIQETLAEDGEGFDFVEYAGTSMATPHVSAAVAMLLSLGASPEEAVALLADTSEDLGRPGPDPIFGHGEIRIDAAVNQFRSTYLDLDVCE